MPNLTQSTNRVLTAGGPLPSASLVVYRKNAAQVKGEDNEASVAIGHKG